MEKDTRLRKATIGKQTRSAVVVARFMSMALLAAGVIAAALAGSIRTQAESQLSYGSTTLSAGNNPSASKVGDLDGDGLNDIAVVNLQGSLQLFFNNGAGSFERTSSNGLWSSSASTLDMDIGDLNGDGRNDIAVAFSTQTGSISVLLNQGSRTFAGPVNYSICSSSRGVAIGDLDQDGDNDLADISECSKAGVLLNNGLGSFGLKGTFGAGSASKSIALADFNRDGLKDIVYVNNGNASITIILNSGNGTFGSPAWYYVGDLPDDLAVGDFNGDGGPDIAVALSYYSQVYILFGDGNGSFFGYSEMYGGDTPDGIASADLNADGRTDLAVISRGNNKLSVLLNQGSYSFAEPVPFTVGQFPVDVTSGDVDGDGLQDLVAVNQGSGTITVLSSAGAPAPPPGSSPITLTVSTRTTRTARLVDLRWGGATGSSVDIYRNGSRIATVSNNGSYADQLDKRAKGSFTYKVCVAGGQPCSSDAAVSF
jgi:hypothetical protein